MPERPTEQMIDAMARRRFERARPQAPGYTWDWLPLASKRQWLEEAREDLDAAFAAVREDDGA